MGPGLAEFDLAVGTDRAERLFGVGVVVLLAIGVALVIAATVFTAWMRRLPENERQPAWSLTKYVNGVWPIFGLLIGMWWIDVHMFLGALVRR